MERSDVAETDSRQRKPGVQAEGRWPDAAGHTHV